MWTTCAGAARSMAAVGADPYSMGMAPTEPFRPRGGTAPQTTLVQTLYLLLGMLAVCAVAGVLMAAFFLPAVSLTSSAAKDGIDLFESYPSELDVEPLNEASRIEAADGSLLATFYSENRIMVPLEKISPHMQHAVIAVEDRRFYQHGGVDLRGMGRAFLSNASGGGTTQGGSTLTQQYVKNALLMDAVQRGDQADIKAATEQTYGRKLREAKLAISLESNPAWDKDKILNAYLNVAQFGPSQYGVETGAQHYFSKPAKDLNPGEAALLAGITNGPNQHDPVAHPKSGQKRRNEVLADMKREGFISQKEFDQYSKQPVKDMLKIKNVHAGCADAGRNGFFCDYVTRNLLNDSKFGKDFKERKRLLYGGGLTIRTTLDPKKQQAAVDILQRRVPADSPSGFGHSIVSVEPGSGKVLVMAENRSFNPHTKIGAGETAINYNVPKSLGGSSGFPVGSTFKPFVLQEWLRTGHSIDDRVRTTREVMQSFPAKCLRRGAWREKAGYNPDNAVSVPIAPMETVLNSTKFSVNTSYANMARQLDLCDIAEGARKVGAVPATFNPLKKETWSAPIEDIYKTELAPSVVVLGELRISALDMSAAYATYAAGGKYCRPQAITQVTDRSGKPLPISGSDCKQVLDKQVADTMAWTLQQDLEDPRATGKGKTIPGHPAGGKTGTSSKQFHTWYVGFSRQMSTAVWFGHPQKNIRPAGFSVDGTPLRGGHVWGNTVSLPTWQEFMTKAHEGLPSEPFPGPPAPPGPPPAQDDTIPEVAGRTRAEAEGMLKQAGYTVAVTQKQDPRVPTGKVIGTKPAIGTKLPKGQKVTIIESSGQGG